MNHPRTLAAADAIEISMLGNTNRHLISKSGLVLTVKACIVRFDVRFLHSTIFNN